MKLSTFSALAVEFGFAASLAFAQTTPPPAQQPNGTASSPAKPATPRLVAKKTPSPVDNVVQLVKGGMSESFIIKYLQKNNKPMALTPGDVVRLKEAGVSETIITVMMDPASAPASPLAPAPIEAPAPLAPSLPPPPSDPTPPALPVAAPVPAQKTNGDPKVALEERIERQYPLTQLNGDKTDIVTPGAVLMLKRNGLVMYTGDAMAAANTYKGGKITQNMLGAFQKNTTDGSVRTFVKGEKFWITQIDAKDAGLVLQFISDPLPEKRYHGTLKFQWSKTTRPSADEIVALVAEVVQNVGMPGAQQVAIQQPLAPNPSSPPEPAMAPISPPPAPAPSIQLGQTKDQIVAALGQPTRIANVGTKQILYFNSVKVTLVSGKATVIE